jgi:hypothetical protein
MHLMKSKMNNIIFLFLIISFYYVSSDRHIGQIAVKMNVGSNNDITQLCSKQSDSEPVF